MDLPSTFLEEMKKLLKHEFDAFINTYDEVPFQGLRLNLNKITPSHFLSIYPTLKPIPWVEEGYYFEETDKTSKHPYHDAGMYYIQEPSAMSVGTFVKASQEEVILDLCASPGGKTSHMASHMRNTGLIVANEIYPTRAKTLSQNVERMGITNTVITQETPKRLALHFPDFFDKVLIDAPCSGEGMFRKDKDMLKTWSPAYVIECVERQKEIVDEAVKMLKPGGTLVYSTCTFNVLENEGIIDYLIKTYPDFEVVEQTLPKGFSNGITDGIVNPSKGLEHTVRLWPHHLSGEGHFIAVLKRKGTLHASPNFPIESNRQKELVPFEAFMRENVTQPFKGHVTQFNDHLYMVPLKMNALTGLKIVRAGLYMGSVNKDRFEPSHALALALSPETWRLVYRVDERQAIDFFKGLTFSVEGLTKGYTLIVFEEAVLGFGKYSEPFMKNHYPKGKRWN